MTGWSHCHIASLVTNRGQPNRSGNLGGFRSWTVSGRSQLTRPRYPSPASHPLPRQTPTPPPLPHQSPPNRHGSHRCRPFGTWHQRAASPHRPDQRSRQLLYHDENNHHKSQRPTSSGNISDNKRVSGVLLSGNGGRGADGTAQCAAAGGVRRVKRLNAALFAIVRHSRPRNAASTFLRLLYWASGQSSLTIQSKFGTSSLSETLRVKEVVHLQHRVLNWGRLHLLPGVEALSS